MSSLEQRLAIVAEYAAMNQKEIARAARITPAAASKLFTGKSKEIKAAHAFAIARSCGVDAEWLATGRGQAPTKTMGVRDKPAGYASRHAIAEEFEPRHIDLLRMYKRLPKDVRHHIRSMIQTLAAAQREDYNTWIREQRAALVAEDA